MWNCFNTFCLMLSSACLFHFSYLETTQWLSNLNGDDGTVDPHIASICIEDEIGGCDSNILSVCRLWPFLFLWDSFCVCSWLKKHINPIIHLQIEPRARNVSSFHNCNLLGRKFCLNNKIKIKKSINGMLFIVFINVISTLEMAIIYAM